ncbi:hypothetical protein [Sphingomonas sp. Leaf33]|uniref:hypothetical protein n=1 Tax=Sphingomonas sp. Leaf33 TaxID=1736215 RepID=UPI0012E258F7|nr:hypothetical protein [Sphingomonas sp. Leaf33]
MRIFSASLSLILASCGGPPDTVVAGNGSDTQIGDTGTPAGAPVERIACALGDAEMAQACTVERTPAEGGTLITIRHPDGGFHRLRISADGQVGAADGALPPAVSVRDGVADITLGDARYRLPLAQP